MNKRMKTSHKILVFASAGILGIWITCLVLFRNDLRQLIESEGYTRYVPIQAGFFRNLSVSPGWNVKVIQGIRCSVEIEDSVSGQADSLVVVCRDTLVFRSTGAGKTVHAKVILPAVISINARGNSRIHMGYFTLDTLRVSLQGGVHFSGHNNDINCMRFNSKGDNQLRISKGEWQ